MEEGLKRYEKVLFLLFWMPGAGCLPQTARFFHIPLHRKMSSGTDELFQSFLTF